MIRNLKALGLAMVAAFALSAMAASAAQATVADFAADSYPAHIIANGIGIQTFTTAGGTKLTCEEVGVKRPATGTATLSAESSSLIVTGPEGGGILWHNCHATVLKSRSRST